jgi:prephenate dehydrogenase
MMLPADHDRLVSWISHLPQLAASALMRVIGEAVGEDGLGYAGRGLRDTTRLASSPAHVWTDICLTNADSIAIALDTLVADLQWLREHLDDSESVARVFGDASTWRERLG